LPAFARTPGRRAGIALAGGRALPDRMDHKGAGSTFCQLYTVISRAQVIDAERRLVLKPVLTIPRT